jgi:hypothetical protein
MHGIWVPPKTITNATYIVSLKHGENPILGLAELFPQHCQVLNLSNMTHLKALTKELKTATSLRVKTHKGCTFIHKLKIAIDVILNADKREEQKVSMPNVAAPPAMTSIKLPIQQIKEVPPIMKTRDPTGKRNLINTKCTHQCQTHNNTLGDVPAITRVPSQIIPTDVNTPHEKRRLTCILTQKTYPAVKFRPYNNPSVPCSRGNKSKCTFYQTTSPQYVDDERGT